MKAVSSTEWTESMFRAITASYGGVLKRKIYSVETHASEAQLIAAATRRGYHVYKTETHYLIFCSPTVQLTQVC